MSLLSQVRDATINTMRQIDGQISKLVSYRTRIDSLAQQVDAALGDSRQQYSRQMTDQLALTKRQVSLTIDELQSAKDKLLQMEMRM